MKNKVKKNEERENLSRLLMTYLLGISALNSIISSFHNADWFPHKTTTNNIQQNPLINWKQSNAECLLKRISFYFFLFYFSLPKVVIWRKTSLWFFFGNPIRQSTHVQRRWRRENLCIFFPCTRTKLSMMMLKFSYNANKWEIEH